MVARQLAASLPEKAKAGDTVIAYEPVWAIGTGLTPTVEDVAEVHGFLRRTLAERLGAEGKAMRILYGGSVKPDNARTLMARRRRQRRAGRRSEPQSRRLSCHHRRLPRLTVAPEKRFSAEHCMMIAAVCKGPHDALWHDARLAAMLLQGTGAQAGKLDKESCARLEAEQVKLEQGGTTRQLGKGAEWAKVNLAPDKLQQIGRLIDVSKTQLNQ